MSPKKQTRYICEYHDGCSMCKGCTNNLPHTYLWPKSYCSTVGLDVKPVVYGEPLKIEAPVVKTEWEMDYDHSTFMAELNTLVLLPSKHETSYSFSEIIEKVLGYGFAIRYDEGSHALQVRQCDWELVNSLVNSMKDRSGS